MLRNRAFGNGSGPRRRQRPWSRLALDNRAPNVPAIAARLDRPARPHFRSSFRQLPPDLALLADPAYRRRADSASNPIAAKTLTEFWGILFNLGFRHLAHYISSSARCTAITGAAGAGFPVFVVSGLIHDLVISLPGARRPRPVYRVFRLCKDSGVMLERSKTSSAASDCKTKSSPARSLSSPLPSSGVLAPSSAIRLAGSHPLHASTPRPCTATIHVQLFAERLFDLILCLAGVSDTSSSSPPVFQVPSRLRWKENLRANLMASQPKEMLWVQSSFTVLTINAFCTLTPRRAAQRTAPRRPRCVGPRLLYRKLLTARVSSWTPFISPTKTGRRAVSFNCRLSFC